jgi:transcriptional antiterminator RfaH
LNERLKLCFVGIFHDFPVMTRWYVVYTKTQAEATARAHLSRQGFDVYFPRVLQKIRRAGRWIEQVSPLFPRYLFAGLEEQRQALAPVRSTVGVVGVVKFGAQYTTVPESVLRDLRSRADPESGLHRLQQPAGLVAGSPVQIASGPFSGLEAAFERAVGSERVLVLLNVLGTSVSVRMPVDALIPQFAGRFA